MAPTARAEAEMAEEAASEAAEKTRLEAQLKEEQAEAAPARGASATTMMTLLVLPATAASFTSSTR